MSVPPSGTPDWITASTAASRQAAPPFMSCAPRPYSRSPMVVGVKGGVCQPAKTSKVSRCRLSISTGPSAGPSQRPKTVSPASGTVRRWTLLARLVWRNAASQSAIACSLPVTDGIATRVSVSSTSRAWLRRASGSRCMRCSFPMGWQVGHRCIRLPRAPARSPPSRTGQPIIRQRQPERSAATRTSGPGGWRRTAASRRPGRSRVQ